METAVTQNWSPRVKPARVCRLYKLNALGVYDEALLADVGWALHDRCRDALVVNRAMRGEVPCPQCGETVPRPRRRRRRQGPPGPNVCPLACPECGREVTWQACRDALRAEPRCFDCLQILRWNYEANRLNCRRCGREWTRQGYSRSVGSRVRLPCALCHRRIRQPDPDGAGAPAGTAAEPVECPECGTAARHASGRLSCAACGYDVEWRRYRRRMKRRAERLTCPCCGHEFTWQSWRRRYAGQSLLTGMPAPLQRFAATWPVCRTPQEQMIAIDRLLHAVHGRGALAPVLIEGSQASVSRLLDELADRR
jgi:hypothetical protein